MGHAITSAMILQATWHRFRALVVVGMAAAVICPPLQPVAAQGLRAGPARDGAEARFRAGTRLMDGRLGDQFAPEAQRRTALVPPYAGAYRGPYYVAAVASARRHGIPEDLFARLVQAESAWNVAAVSSKGARGLAQLMPGTAQMLRVQIDDPHENLDGGARYLRAMYDRFRSWPLALAAYNAGPDIVSRHNDVPPFEETQTYVRRILGR